MSLKKVFTRLIYPICISLFFALSIIYMLGVFAVRDNLFRELEELTDVFVEVNSEVIKNKDIQQLAIATADMMRLPDVAEIKVTDSYDTVLAYSQKKNVNLNSFLFLSSPLSIETRIKFNDTNRSDNSIEIREDAEFNVMLAVDCADEVNQLKSFLLLLVIIFILFTVVSFFFLRHSNNKMNKELLLIEDSIDNTTAVESIKTMEFNIQELALFQRKIKNDSKDLQLLKEELERKKNLALIGNFAASIVHDIRNPLAVIEGFSQLLKMTSEGQALGYVDRIVSSSSMIERMLEDILKFVREQKLELKLERNRPAAVIRRAVDFFENSGNSKGVQVIVKADEILNRNLEIKQEEDGKGDGTNPDDFMFECDIDRLSRALMNLVKNSIEASPSESLVTVKAIVEENDVIFSVADSGSGIPERIRPMIFEPFSTADKKKGTGLGLFIVKNIVEAHKGTISFDTGPDGTTFYIKIPVQ